MAVLQDININVYAQPSDKRLRTFLSLSQNENGRLINFRILGSPLPSNCTAVFSGTKPDGNVYSKAGTVAGNFVIVQEDIQMTAVAGVWDAKLDIINGSHNIMTAMIRVMVERGTVAPGSVPSNSQLDGYVAQCKSYAEHARTDAYGSPLTATTAAEMTDKTRVYVYTGSESGMTAGNWYTWNGSAWVSGGVYNAVAVQTDATLSVAGKAADAKKVGDEISAVKEDLSAVEHGVSIDVQRAKSDDNKLWGGVAFNMFSYCGQVLTIVNNGTSAIWFGQKDVSNNNIVDTTKINSGASAQITVATIPDHFSIYSDTYPIDVNITSTDMSTYLDGRVNSLKEATENVTIDYLDGKICYVNLSDFDTETNRYYSNNLTPIAPTDSNVYHIAPAFIVPAGTYSYYGIDSYWSFTVTASGTKTRLGSGGASGTVTLAESSTVYLSTRENITGYTQANWVSGNEIYGSAPTKGYFSEKVERIDGFTQVMATVGMFGTVAGLGDSYTATSVKNSAGIWVDYPSYSWLATLCNRSGVSQYNYGVGGATIKSYASTNMFNNNVLGSDPKDLYFICFGINDYLQSLTVGTVADINDSDYTQNADSFCGWYGRVIAQLKAHAPNAKIVLIKPWTSVASASEYGDAVSAIAEHYSIPCIDPYDDVFFYGGYLTPSINAGHPTLMGYNMIGLAMERLFSECVVSNPSYFKYSTVG